jgi:hypothetical protein
LALVIDRPDISSNPSKPHASLWCLYPLLDEAARNVIRTTPNVDGLALLGTEASDANDPSGTTQSTTVTDTTKHPEEYFSLTGRRSRAGSDRQIGLGGMFIVLALWPLAQ